MNPFAPRDPEPVSARFGGAVRTACSARADPLEPLSDGEVHYLWHFIQGGFMEPSTRLGLRRAWGMCERHAFAFLAVDAAFRHGHLHGPALLYEDLMQAALAVMGSRGPLRRLAVARALRDAGRCPMCSFGFGPGSPGFPSPDVAARGRDLSEIRRFALDTERAWRADVCGRCAGSGARARCRVHLAEELQAGREVAADGERARVARIALEVRRYSRSFRWELRGSDTLEDRAALVGAAGWCGGWGAWLRLVDNVPGRGAR